MHKKGVIISVFFILVSALFVSFVFAEEAFSPPRNELTSKLSDNLICKIDFNIKVLKDLNVSNSNLHEYMALLNNDRVQLQLLVNTNTSAIKAFVSSNMDSHINTTRNYASTLRRAIWANLTKEQKQGIRANYSKYSSELEECQKNSIYVLADKRVASINADIEIYRNKTIALAERNISVEGLNRIIREAQTQIALPLQNALVLARTARESQEAVMKYCLFDGCKRGVNFHLAAKFEVEKLFQIMKWLSTQEGVNQESLAKAQTALSEARRELSIIGSSSYQQRDKEQLWNSIKDASNALQEARSSLKGVKK